MRLPEEPGVVGLRSVLHSLYSSLRLPEEDQTMPPANPAPMLPGAARPNVSVVVATAFRSGRFSALCAGRLAVVAALTVAALWSTPASAQDRSGDTLHKLN